MDWLTYIEPLFGLNITPWNPGPALGLICWLKYGRSVAPYWLAAIIASEVLVRDIPEGPILTVLTSTFLTMGYGLTGEWLRRHFTIDAIFNNRIGLMTCCKIIAIGTFANGLIFLLLLQVFGFIPPGEWSSAFVQFWVGEFLGILVAMPFLWLLASGTGRAALWSSLIRSETAGYLVLSVAVIWFVFVFSQSSEVKHFYFLFIPIVWASTRQGLVGTAIISLVLQIAVVIVVEWLVDVDGSVFELQLLDAVLALVGFFIGVVVDEQRKAAEDLKQTLRLTVAGDMATALAHELNQPITALAAYGNACEYLLAKGETGEILKDTIKRMVTESERAADVVRRLREFFHSGAVRLKAVRLDTLLSEATKSSRQLAQDRGVEFNMSTAPSLGVLADSLQLGVVMHNLLSNSIDSVIAQSEGGRRIDISTELQANKTVLVTIEDSGPGVTAILAGRLFEPFFSSKSSGFGLGLVISRAIVEAHGGRLWVEVGTHGIFKLELPLAEIGKDEQ